MSKQFSISPDNGRWIVDFTLRIVNEEQRRVVDALGANRVHALVRLWLELITPNHVVEPLGTPIEKIQFKRRSDMRRFMKVWGGRAITRPASS